MDPHVIHNKREGIQVSGFRVFQISDFTLALSPSPHSPAGHICQLSCRKAGEALLGELSTTVLGRRRTLVVFL